MKVELKIVIKIMQVYDHYVLANYCKDHDKYGIIQEILTISQFRKPSEVDHQYVVEHLDKLILTTKEEYLGISDVH